MTDPVNVFWCFIGILVWPELTLCVILWMLGHPVLGVCALFLAETTSVKKIVKKIVKTKIVDSSTGRVVKETRREYEES